MKVPGHRHSTPADSVLELRAEQRSNARAGEQESLLVRVLLVIVLAIMFLAFLITALSGDTPMMPPKPLQPPGISLAFAASFSQGDTAAAEAGFLKSLTAGLEGLLHPLVLQIFEVA